MHVFILLLLFLDFLGSLGIPCPHVEIPRLPFSYGPLNIIDCLKRDNRVAELVSTAYPLNEVKVSSMLSLTESIDRGALIYIEDVDAEEHLAIGLVPEETHIKHVQHPH